jgi:hypothetical protein
MKPHRWYLSALLAGAMVLSGCQLISPTPDQVSPADSDAPVTHDPATLAPEQLPTAEPLWTPTIAPEGETAVTDTASATAPVPDASVAALGPTVAVIVNGQQILRSDDEARQVSSRRICSPAPDGFTG